MRLCWSILSGSMVLAFLQLANCLFEAVGSVPDLEGGGFFAGGLAIQAVIYAVIAGLVGFHFPYRFWRFRSDEASLAGGAMGAAGAMLYGVIGVTLVLTRGQYEAFSPLIVLWSAVYVFLCFLGARGGALCSADPRRIGGDRALRDSGI